LVFQLNFIFPFLHDLVFLKPHAYGKIKIKIAETYRDRKMPYSKGMESSKLCIVVNKNCLFFTTLRIMKIPCKELQRITLASGGFNVNSPYDKLEASG
jgi:hypothetical protein